MMLDRAAEVDASRMAEDKALDHELDNLKYRVKHVLKVSLMLVVN
jgi:hypothetical protein